MRLRGLVFERFGPFERAEVDFCDPSGRPHDVILFVGEGGSGKSTLLRGIAGLLAEAAGTGEELGEDLVRRNANQARCRLVFDDALDGDDRVVITLEKELPGSGLRSQGALERWRHVVERETSARAAFSVAEEDEAEGDEDDSLFAWFASLEGTVEWEPARATLDRIVRPHRLARVLAGDLVFASPAGFATAEELGDGFVSVLVMALELLRLSLESKAEDLLYVIDDLDAHLHPRLASRLVPDLRRAFPRVQLVASTHSPYVVASVPPAQVRRIESAKRIQSVAERVGRGTTMSSVMELAFGVPGLVGPQWLHAPELAVRREVLALYDEAIAAGAHVYAFPGPVHARDVKNAFGESVMGAGANGTGDLFFVDLAPGTTWGHPCEYAFRGRDGGIVRQRSIWPPVELAQFVPLLSQG